MGIEYLVLLLIAFMLIAALVAVESRDLLSSVIALGAAGFALSVIDLLVGAPDLAITQVVVEIIALVLLIRVILTRKDTSAVTHNDALRTGVSLLACGVFLAVVFFAIGGIARLRAPAENAEVAKTETKAEGVIPAFGQPVLTNDADAAVPPGVSAQYLGVPDGPKTETGLPAAPGTTVDTGAANTVMGVLLDYRAYDTLGEATVIFVSILGAYAVLRRVGRRKKEDQAT